MESRDRREVISLSDLLSYTGTADVGDLEEQLDTVVDIDTGDDVIHLETSDDSLGIVALWSDTEELAYPFTMVEFWAAVLDLGRRAERRYAVRMLPDESILDGASPFLVLDAMGEFLGHQSMEVFAALGGGWRRIDGAELPVLDTDVAWYGAGDPLQLIIGFAPDVAAAIEPVIVPHGLLGPGGVAAGAIVEVELHRPDTLAELTAASGEISHVVSERHGVCRGCRNYRDLGMGSDRVDRYCRDCQVTYLGTIFD